MAEFDTQDWSFSSSIHMGDAPTKQPSALTGTIIGDRYELLDELGRGGMGAVFRAREVSSGREVAVKVVLQGGAGSETRWARFVREGELAASLNHPGIVRVHSAGTEGGRPYLVYELVEGNRTLSEAVEGLGLRERVILLRDVALGLGAAHALGIVHRDVKPGNILVDVTGAARVTDFGLATALDLGTLTNTGVVLGTPSHMAPEQVTPEENEPPTPATDVWALGVILYWLMTNELPFAASSWVELAIRIVEASPRPPRSHDPTLPVSLETVCLKCLRTDQGDRYPDGTVLARDLDAYLEGREVEARPMSSVSQFLRRRKQTLALTGALVLSLAIVLAVVAATALRPKPKIDATPTVRIFSPRDGVETREATVRLKGRIAPASWGAVARVGSNEHLIDPGGEFSIRLPLRPGDNPITVQPISKGGEPAGAAAHFLVRYDDAPSWFHRLQAPPPRPLPKGVRIGNARGEFVARDGSVLVWVPPGEFTMGADGGVPSESPAHQVRFSQGYFIGKHELTWGQYRRFASETGREPLPYPPASDAHPATAPSWEDARAYCAWAGLRLPTEAEWEYAARGERGGAFPWGSEFPNPGDFSYRPSEDSVCAIEPVGSFPKDQSPFGCYDMAGNVCEWVADWYEAYPPDLQVDPFVSEPGPEGPALRIYRGGAFCNSPGSCRSLMRRAVEPDFVAGHVGFRVACSPR